MRFIRVTALLLSLVFAGSSVTAAERVHRGRHEHHHQLRHTLVHKGGWAGAGLAAGHFAGPAGSASVGAVKYRRDLKKNWHTRRRAMVKIGAPIAAGVAAGPAGVAGYEAYDHRHWIKHHLVPGKHHHRRKTRHPQRHASNR